MFKRSFSSWMILFLVTIGFLPSGQSKVKDWMGFLVWLALQMAASILWFYSYADYLKTIFVHPGISTTLTFISTLLVPVLVTGGPILALSCPMNAYPFIIDDQQLPPPTASFILLILIPLHLVIAYVWLDVWLTSILQAAIVPFNTTIPLIGLFMIGTYSSQITHQIQEANLYNNKSAQKFAKNIITQFKSLKAHLSPLLFNTLAAFSLTLLGNVYTFYVHTTKSNGWEILTAIATSSLSIVYVCYTMDRCFSAYKSLVESLR